jgi:hypothetical protein
LEGKRNEEYFCEKCSTKDLYYKLEGLVDKLVGEKKVEVVVEKKSEVLVKKKMEPIVVVERKRKGVLYKRFLNGKWGWYKSGNEGWVGKYVGEFENGKPNGQGTYRNKFGEKYVVDYMDGERYGQGTLTYSNGRKFVGEWEDGIPWNGKVYDKNGNIIGKLENGVEK